MTAAMIEMPPSVFEKYIPKAYPYRYQGTIHVGKIAGGIPTDPKVAEAWLKTKLGHDNEELIRAQVAETMVERGLTLDEAVAAVDANRHLNGFKRDADDGLYIEGRQLKAAIKEAANTRWPAPFKWGKYKNTRDKEVGGKISTSFFAEHVFVEEDRLYLGVAEPSGVAQRFVHTFRGAGIQYEEYCDNVEFDFTVVTDHLFTAEQWGLLWLTGEQQGIGATRSQGYGRYHVTRWATVQT